MKRPAFAQLPTAAFSIAALALLAGCSGGGSTGTTAPGGNFLVVKTEPVNGASIFLNDPIDIDFTHPVDLDSANLLTVSFQALDQQGNPLAEQVSGNFILGTSPGDQQPGRRLRFVPRFPTNNTYTNGGFRPGRRYLVQVVGGTANNNTVLRDTSGRGLQRPTSFTFTTREGTQPAQLFRNPLAGGPRRVGLEVTTATDLQNVPLALFGAPPLEVRLLFDQALNPSDTNVPVNFDPDPLVRNINLRGRIYLEYDDPILGDSTWIPASVELERNDLLGATVALRPAGVLPNNALLRIIVDPALEDIAGESNLGNPAYPDPPVFGVFRTTAGYQQQWNGIAEDFIDRRNIDPLAAFPESQAEVGVGFVRAGFAFEGNPTSLEYEPTTNEVVLNTAFTQVVPKAGLPFTVTGGVFNFRNVTIPQGVTVTGQGPNPMVWLVGGKFTVAGTLSVSGGPGARVDTLNSANFAKAGGVGVCGGGNGGDGTPSATQRDLRGGTGRGPLQEAGKGGRGGYLACVSGCYTGSGYNSSGGGSGGGGGSMATQGDPFWRGALPTTPLIPNTPPTANTAFQQRRGFGGTGCSGGSGTRTFPAGQSGFILPGGEPGDLVFRDSRIDNDFWGSGIDISRGLRITGEMTVPVGGGGGGGGGDTSPTFNCTLTGGDPANDYSGGGGGGGGGVLIVKALDEILITSTGVIRANGGNGGGGEQVGSCGEAGGGGAGAGGMVVLMSAKSIVIEAHGNTATNRFVYGAPTAAATPTHPFLRDDYNFAISADGGICATGGFGAVNIQNKYPQSGQAMLAGTQYDTEPLGALGGMGIVQLMVPPGEDNADNTNTRLDDNIIFRMPATSGTAPNLTGAAKRQLLGWRGFPQPNGQFVDDFGNPFVLGDNEGDIRPAPILTPVPFGARSRVRSKWIDTGRSQRRPLAAPDGLPRGIVTAGGATVGPAFEFNGTFTTGQTPGFVAFTGANAAIDYGPPVMTAAAIESVDPNASFLGRPAYLLRLAAPNAALSTHNRYVQYEAEILNSATATSPLVGFRIVSHTDREILVDPGFDVLPIDGSHVRILAKFFRVFTTGSEGLGGTYTAIVNGQEERYPASNVRFGFAFHQNPNPNNLLLGRYPSTGLQDFVFDLNDPGLQAWIQANGAPRYVQWDITFDLTYQPSVAAPPGLRPAMPRPEVRSLRLPFRF